MVQPELSERDLIERAKVDPESFGTLYDMHYDRILNYCIRRTGSVRTGADLCSDTFIKALRHITGYRWSGAPFSSWLYAIANRAIADYFRSRKYTPLSLQWLEESGIEPADTADLEAELIEAEHILELHSSFLEVQRVIQSLDLKYQEVLTLRFFESKKISEVSEILAKKENTVKSLLKRGLELVRSQCNLPPDFTL